MKKPKGLSIKHKYLVMFKNHRDYGDGFIEEDEEWEALGTTVATSEAKAISNVRYRNDIHHYANEFHEWAGDGLRRVIFKAVRIYD